MEQIQGHLRHHSGDGSRAPFIGVFLPIAYRIGPAKDLPAAIDLRIRAFGSCAFLMLTVILSIGPLARLDRRFLPLPYNRRHFGVLTFVIASLHVWFMLEWYAVQGTLPNLLTELMTWGDYGKFIRFPFKVLGIMALVVLFLMAATSHDFWLAFLTPRAWVRIRDGIVEVIRKRCRRHAVIDHMSGNCGFAAALVVALSRLLHSRSQSRPEPGGVQ
jgi:DMSO/TMAO reductase YedYZ heme-binding membrane subunit